ncbi:MAG: hypothetical protein ACRCXZ_04480 [Patescibacteria group bacterium]
MNKVTFFLFTSLLCVLSIGIFRSQISESLNTQNPFQGSAANSEIEVDFLLKEPIQLPRTIYVSKSKRTIEIKSGSETLFSNHIQALGITPGPDQTPESTESKPFYVRQVAVDSYFPLAGSFFDTVLNKEVSWSPVNHFKIIEKATSIESTREFLTNTIQSIPDFQPLSQRISFVFKEGKIPELVLIKKDNYPYLDKVLRSNGYFFTSVAIVYFSRPLEDTNSRAGHCLIHDLVDPDTKDTLCCISLDQKAMLKLRQMVLDGLIKVGDKVIIRP